MKDRKKCYIFSVKIFQSSSNIFSGTLTAVPPVVKFTWVGLIVFTVVQVVDCKYIWKLTHYIWLTKEYMELCLKSCSYSRQTQPNKRDFGSCEWGKEISFKDRTLAETCLAGCVMPLLGDVFFFCQKCDFVWLFLM